MSSEEEVNEFIELMSQLGGEQEIVNLKFENQYDCEPGGQHMPKEYSDDHHVAVTAMLIKTRMEQMADAAADAAKEHEGKIVLPYALFELHFTTHGMYVIKSDYMEEWIDHIATEDGHPKEWVDKIFETAIYRIITVNSIEKVNQAIPGTYRLLNLGKGIKN